MQILCVVLLWSIKNIDEIKTDGIAGLLTCFCVSKCFCDDGGDDGCACPPLWSCPTLQSQTFRSHTHYPHEQCGSSRSPPSSFPRSWQQSGKYMYYMVCEIQITHLILECLLRILFLDLLIYIFINLPSTVFYFSEYMKGKYIISSKFKRIFWGWALSLNLVDIFMCFFFTL